MFGFLAQAVVIGSWLILSLAQASASDTAPQALDDKDCSGQRSELRERAAKILNVDPASNFRDGSVYKKLMAEHCNANIEAPANRSSSRHGHCERTYASILALINSADRKGEEACSMGQQAAEKASQCKGQKICQQLVARSYRNAERLMIAAKDTTSKAEKWLQHYIIRHGQVAQRYAAHLRVIAEAIEKHDREQRSLQAMRPMTYIAPTAAQRQRAISEEVRKQLNASVKSTEGVSDFETLLRETGVGLDPPAIRAKADDIERTSRLSAPSTETIAYEDRYGDWAGEQLLARNRAQGLLPVVRQANDRLDAGAQAYAQAALQLEGNAERGASLPVNPERIQQAAPAAPRIQVQDPPRQLASAETISSSSASMPIRATTGASAPTPGALQGIKPGSPGAQGQGGAARPRAAPGRRLALSPGETAGLAEELGRPLAASEQEHDVARVEARAVAPEAQGEESEAGGAGEKPGATFELSGGPPPSGLSQPAAPAQSFSAPSGFSSRAPAADANAVAYADRQLKRMEQGRNFGPSLRDRLRAKLAADYKNRSGNTRAAADLFEEMQREQQWESDAAGGKGEEQMDTLNSQEESLFARVQAAHRRSVSQARVQ